MSDLLRWVELWEREPKLRPQINAESIDVYDDGSVCWYERDPLAPGEECSPELAAALIRDAAVRWLLHREDTRWLSLDTDESKKHVFLECHLMSTEDFITDPATWWERVIERRKNPDELSASLREATPNDGHFAMAELERAGVLKHTITQNVDNLHRLAGSQAITEIHGNTQWLRCLQCNTRSPFDEIPEERPPRCDQCGGLVKTDTVMFGEPIPRDALEACIQQASRADCMLLVGTTARRWHAPIMSPVSPRELSYHLHVSAAR